MTPAFDSMIGYEIRPFKSVFLWAGLGAVLLMCAAARVMAQAEAGPMRASAGQQAAADAPPQPQPRQRMRPMGTGFGAAPATAVQLPAATQDLNAQLSSALAGWKDSSGAARAPRVVVLDFCTWDNQWIPFGAWLADNVSAALANNGGMFTIIDRARLSAVLQSRQLSPKDEFQTQPAMELAQSLAADILVNGRYRALENDLGLNVNVRPALAVERPRPILFVKSRITMSSEMAGHLGEPLATLGPTRNANSAGANGNSYPKCSYCPAAPYSEEGRKKKINGVVLLSVLVTAEGSASDVQVKKSLEPSLDQQAVATVSSWRFDPAKDANGVPVAVRVAVEVSFHLY